MPVLDENDLRVMRMDIKRCPQCTQFELKNYCRQCDEFFRYGHDRNCPHFDPASDKHRSHRTY